MAYRIVLLCAVAATAVHVVTGEQINGGLVNKVVSTSLDLTTHLAKFATSVTIENGGQEPAAHVHYIIDPMLANKLAFFGVELSNKEKTRLDTVHHVILPGRDEYAIRIELPQPLLSGATIKLKVTSVYGRTVEPHPRKIVQSDKQLVLFTCSGVYYLSPYPTTTQTLTVSLPAATSIEAFTRVKPVAADGSQVVYGPYADVSPYTSGAPKSLALHYENNSPFLVVQSLDRLIEVSHWGNIAVEEVIHVQHEGAELKGPFSRYDYQRNPNSGRSSVKSYKSLLPAAARDVYYRDEIGNISTSHMREDEDTVEVELRPRFPLFGGWQTKYTIGYNVPGYEYLWHDGSHFVLRMRLMDHVFDEQLVDHMTLTIILPEGARDVSLKAPYPLDEEERDVRYTYLDTVGRPVVIIKKSNLVEQHILEFELSYDFKLYMLLQEPLLVVTFLLAIFLTVVVCVRLDFSISEDKTELSRQQVAIVLEKLRSSHDQRLAAVRRLDGIVGTYKSNKDQKKFNAATKDMIGQFNDATQQISVQHKQLVDLEPDTANKVQEVQRRSGDLLVAVRRSVELGEQVVAERIKKDKYIDEEKKARDKRQRLLEEMEGIVRGL